MKKEVEFYENGVRTGKFGGFAVQGYLCENFGQVRLSREGQLELYLYADKTGMTWAGPMKLSTRAKKVATDVCRILERQYKAL